MTARRAFCRASALALLALAGTRAVAQRRTTPARIGCIVTGQVGKPLLDAFRAGMQSLGYVEGRDYALDIRSAEGRVQRFPELAADLARAAPDVVLAGNTPAARAMRDASRAIPIVSPSMGDPVGDGLVASFSRPGGNVTGLTFLGPELIGKRLSLLVEALPSLVRLGALWHPAGFPESTNRAMVEDLHARARDAGLKVQLVAVDNAGAIADAFAQLVNGRAQGLIVFPSTMLFQEQARIAGLAIEQALPAIGIAREFADAGGLMAYGASIPDLFRRAASYVDRILKGAKPGDLPVERPSKFEFVLNARTAKAIGLALPPPLLLRADEVIA